MIRRIALNDAKENFGQLLETVHNKEETVILEKRGEPFAVIIGPKEYEFFLQRVKDHFFQIVDKIHEANKDEDPEEVYRIVTEVVEEVRQERYERSADADRSAT